MCVWKMDHRVCFIFKMEVGPYLHWGGKSSDFEGPTKGKVAKDGGTNRGWSFEYILR